MSCHKYENKGRNKTGLGDGNQCRNQAAQSGEQTGENLGLETAEVRGGRMLQEEVR